MLVGMYDNPAGFAQAAAMGVSNYGQMTAGGWMYIGPQGIVHGTYLTLLNAGRMYLGIPAQKDLAGVVYLSSGLGGMSGAQAKAVEIAGGIGVLAEVDYSRIETRHKQGWVSRISADLDEVARWIDEFRKSKKPVSIAYHGNVVDLWQYVLDHDIPIELASDQTSCHDAYGGGYTPAGVTFEEGRRLLREKPELFRKKVDESLVRQFRLIQKMAARGTRFWDYGNSFLKAVFDAGATDIAANGAGCQRRLHFPQLCRAYHGAAGLRLRLRAVPLGMPERQAGRPGRDRPGRHGVPRPRPPGHGPRQLRMDQECREEQAGGRHPGAHPLCRRRGDG